MNKIGIIANPDSGKDIRRLVGQALVVGSQEKVNIVKRALIGAQAAGASEFMIMPDRFHIGDQCIHDLKHQFPDLAAGINIADMPVLEAGADSTHAARLIREWGADCVIVLGGDGTVRMVDKGAGEMPILPISTGTNNVIPEFIEGTTAGLAAGYFSRMPEDLREKVIERQKRLAVNINHNSCDSALVDIAMMHGQHTGSRAVWDSSQLLQVAVTRASPAAIGISSIVAQVQPIAWDDPFGALLRVNGAQFKRRVQAVLGPGMIVSVGVGDLQELHPESPVDIIDVRPAVLALDGERDLVLNKVDRAAVTLSLDGPLILNYRKVIDLARISKIN